MTRIFYLEPFLIKAERHFIETSLAVNSYFSNIKNVQFYLIGNRNLDHEVKRLLPNVIPLISQTCFESLDDKGQSFLTDLLELNKKYVFTNRDLVIIPTGYENQILGIGKFIDIFNDTSCPKFSVQVHQLFPPVPESDDIEKVSFRRFWMRRLREAFKTIKSKNVSFWTTESSNLVKDLSRVSGKRFGILPVPYLNLEINSNTYLSLDNSKSHSVKFAFLGEGRQEKGLLYFMRAIVQINKLENDYLFVIQNMNPRGYTSAQKVEFDSLLSKLSRYQNVIVINGGMPPVDFHSLLSQIDCLVLPYNPINYYRRVSGVLIQAVIYQKSAIVASDTWAAGEINKNKAAGLVFKYLVENQNQTTINLIQAIDKFDKFEKTIKKSAKLLSNNFKAFNTAGEYLRRIYSYYENNT